jgi:hypothetical protein
MRLAFCPSTGTNGYQNSRKPVLTGPERRRERGTGGDTPRPCASRGLATLGTHSVNGPKRRCATPQHATSVLRGCGCLFQRSAAWAGPCTNPGGPPAPRHPALPDPPSLAPRLAVSGGIPRIPVRRGRRPCEIAPGSGAPGGVGGRDGAVSIRTGPYMSDSSCGPAKRARSILALPGDDRRRRAARPNPAPPPNPQSRPNKPSPRCGGGSPGSLRRGATAQVRAPPETVRRDSGVLYLEDSSSMRVRG